ncbi:unnamed protein product [Sphenostylis stenocarpa]|uniref:Toll-like receptor 3 n=1 Tax=Sphenostylis stenocarpa TaxID=92480 RepID=A0AA86RUK7_9FABA|nr:unnamed protein product [Sphenostylis stenocarpa]
MMINDTLEVLNLKNNNISGVIPDTISFSCGLSTLNLHGNLLDGPIPMSLAHCSRLEVLDLGSNQIIDGFPCFLKEISTLRVMVLRNNEFQGSLRCSNANKTWEMLQIVDISFNNILVASYSVTVTSKGQQMELIKILTIFTSLDFSSNHFEGPIPEEIMALEELHILNLSNKALSGQIPSTIDLSFNHLVGKIPTSTQLQSFPVSSFEGNGGLYGPPLTGNEDGKDPNMFSQPQCERIACSINWDFISVELGLVFGHGIVFGPLLIWKQWRLWYWKLVHKILCSIFPQMYFEYVRQRTNVHNFKVDAVVINSSVQDVE